ncbi:MAG: carbohydrate ABC transporter permease [Anaerolineae bacterium]|nr:carbohydrate ABC transporter permease [Anaerolineae bacterium]
MNTADHSPNPIIPQWLRKNATLAGLYFILAVFLVWTLFPVYWVLLTALKTNDQLRVMPPLFFFEPTLANFETILSGDFLRYFLNSLVISSSTVVVGLLVGFPAAYTLARIRFRRSGQVDFWILSMRMAPPFAFLVPYYLTFRTLGLLDSYPALVIVNMTFVLPFIIWMLKSMIEDLPLEMEEAAMVDGCSRIQVIYRIVAPLMAPGVAATAILAFVFSWNEFFFALILTGNRVKTVPVGMTSLIGLMGVDWPKMAAIGFLSIIPTVILSLLVQRWIVQGLTLGAVKA